MATDEYTDLSTRDRILLAAATMFGEDTSARLSVRAVAARAGVSTGSLRHHFPTQRALREAVLGVVYDQVARDDPIHDRSMPAPERLLGCLRQVLAFTKTREQKRAAWLEVFGRFIEPEPTPDITAAYRMIEEEAHRRVEYWLSVLSEEGALPDGDNARRARFLNTVLNGLSLSLIHI